MKRLTLTCTALALSACIAPPGDAENTPSRPVASNAGTSYDAPAPVRAEVVATLQGLFDALETGDAGLLRSVMDSAVVMHFSETRDGDTTFENRTVDGLAQLVESSREPLIERMWDPVVLTDGPLAMIWTPYDFYVGDTFSHCGVDTANLMATDDGWKIVALAWTRMQPPDCALHPDGPPA